MRVIRKTGLSERWVAWGEGRRSIGSGFGAILGWTKISGQSEIELPAAEFDAVLPIL